MGNGFFRYFGSDYVYGETQDILRTYIIKYFEDQGFHIEKFT